MSDRAWKQIGEFRWECKPWTILANTVNGAPMYSLWRGEDTHATSYSANRADLIRFAKLIEEQEGAKC